MKALTTAALVAALTVCAHSASAAILTFDDYSPVNIGESVINYGGLTFTAAGGFQSVWDGSSPNSNGTNALIDGYGSGTTITRTGGGLFDLLGFDMTISWYNGNPSEDVLINGTLFSIGQGLSTLAVNLFGVSSVTVTGLTDGYWLIDNVNTNVAAVPLPAGLPLLVAGLGGLGLMARRRKAA